MTPDGLRPPAQAASKVSPIALKASGSVTIVWHLLRGTTPEAVTMGAVGVAALVANAAVFVLLWAYRTR
jgi:hypothetical protein